MLIPEQKEWANKMREELSPILDDQPSLTDSLDFKSYVQALKELISHNKTRTPLTLGIFGRWGTGKTTLMRMLEKELDKEGITTIWFNAWQYSAEDELWAAFLQSMLNKIRYSLGSFRLPIFKIKLFFRRIQWDNLPRLIVAFLFRIIVAILPILIIDPVSQKLTPEAKLYLNFGGNITAFVLAILIVIKPIIDSIRKNLSINLSDFQQTSNYQEHIAFLDKFREHFSDIVQSLPKKGNKRLAVFIDDLDRCSPERTIQVLDAIKLFVDVDGCVYILGLDVDVVQKAVASKYKDDPIAQQEYMSKIIQIPFQLPPLTRDEMRKFLEQLAIDLPDPNCQNVFITGLIVNPREVKRTINIFSLLWNLAAKRKELTGKINPIRLAKVVVIQQGYPDLHKILQQRPYLLVELEHFFREEEKRKNVQIPAVNVKETEIAGKQETQDIKKIDLPPELMTFSKNETLRSMLLLHDLPEPSGGEIKDEFSFTFLRPEEVTVYFTLTSRAEALKPNIPDSQSSPRVNPRENPPVNGYVIDGRYKVNYEIGRGALGTIYLAYDQRLNRDVAVRILSGIPFDDQLFKNRFNQELQTLIKLAHPNIDIILDFGTDNGLPYYVSTYFSGGSLKEKLKEKNTLSNKEIVRYLFPILNALSYIHEKGIIHRDIKPSAILFNDINEPYLSRLGFGLLVNSYDDLSGSVSGTPIYMSPESARGEKIDVRSDLYSFGVMLFETVTGKRPFYADTTFGLLMKHINEPIPSPRQLMPEIPVELDKVITKLLAKDPMKRYQSALTVKEALTKILPAESVDNKE